MIREQTLRARHKLVGKLPITGELLRGTLLERTVRHTKDCPKCARGEGHRVFVLTVTYPGHRVRQISVRRERLADCPAPCLITSGVISPIVKSPGNLRLEVGMRHYRGFPGRPRSLVQSGLTSAGR